MDDTPRPDRGPPAAPYGVVWWGHGDDVTPRKVARRDVAQRDGRDRVADAERRCSSA